MGIIMRINVIKKKLEKEPTPIIYILVIEPLMGLKVFYSTLEL